MGCDISYWIYAPFALPIVFATLVAIGMRLDPTISNGYPGHA